MLFACVCPVNAVVPDVLVLQGVNQRRHNVIPSDEWLQRSCSKNADGGCASDSSPSKAARPTVRATGVCRPYSHRRYLAPCGKVEFDHCQRAWPPFRTRRATVSKGRLAAGQVRPPQPVLGSNRDAFEAETGGVVEEHEWASTYGVDKPLSVSCRMGIGVGDYGRR
jgi:hypothetical protein